MNPSAHTRGHEHAIPYMLAYMAYLREIGVNVLNGHEAYFYDINALSNFVANAPNVIGFDPFPRLIDFVFSRARQNGELKRVLLTR